MCGKPVRLLRACDASARSAVLAQNASLTGGRAERTPTPWTGHRTVTLSTVWTRYEVAGQAVNDTLCQVTALVLDRGVVWLDNVSLQEGGAMRA